MKQGKKKTKGTEIILHVSDDEVSYLDGEKIKEILNRYCAFMPVEIYLTVDDKEAELIKTDDYQKKISYCIYIGLLKYLGR
jgi:molecular chaperone HtpG